MAAGMIVLARKAKRAYKKRQPKTVVKVTQTQPKSTASLKKTIRSVINKQAENKQAYTTQSTAPALLKFNSGIDSTADLIQILPNISKGDDENQRNGNQIRAKSFNIKGFLKLDVNEIADSTKLPNVVARLMVVSMKVAPSYQDAITLGSKIGTLLKKGGTTSAFTGLLQDLYAPINTDVFTVHYDKKFYLKQDYINTVGSSAPSTTIAQDVSKTVKFFNINIKCKNKLLRYDEDVGSDVLPGNFGPFLLLGYSYLDGSSPDLVSTPLGLCFDSVLNYTDV